MQGRAAASCRLFILLSAACGHRWTSGVAESTNICLLATPPKADICPRTQPKPLTPNPNPCLEVKGNTMRTAPCCVQQYAHKYERFLNLCLVRVRLAFVCFKVNVWFVFSCFCVSFCASLDHFEFVLLVSFVGFGFFAVPSQEIGWEERVQYDLFCVEWDVKPCSMPYLTLTMSPLLTMRRNVAAPNRRSRVVPFRYRKIILSLS